MDPRTKNGTDKKQTDNGPKGPEDMTAKELTEDYITSRYNELKNLKTEEEIKAFIDKVYVNGYEDGANSEAQE